jgi:hypothetical protein
MMSERGWFRTTWYSEATIDDSYDTGTYISKGLVGYSRRSRKALNIQFDIHLFGPANDKGHGLSHSIDFARVLRADGNSQYGFAFVAYDWDFRGSLHNYFNFDRLKAVAKCQQ